MSIDEHKIESALREGYTYREIADTYNISYSTISKIKKGMKKEKFDSDIDSNQALSILNSQLKELNRWRVAYAVLTGNNTSLTIRQYKQRIFNLITHPERKH